jgi:uncharacterized membrane protein YeaQ/YmgE (transglycosylase-associated protein family)
MRVLLLKLIFFALRIRITRRITNMGLLWTLIVGGLIGWLGGLIVGKNVPGGIIGNIVAGLVGAWLGGLLLGSFGPIVADFAIVPAIIGAIVVVLLLSAIFRSTRRA